MSHIFVIGGKVPLEKEKKNSFLKTDTRKMEAQFDPNLWME